MNKNRKLIKFQRKQILISNPLSVVTNNQEQQDQPFKKQPLPPNQIQSQQQPYQPQTIKYPIVSTECDKLQIEYMQQIEEQVCQHDGCLTFDQGRYIVHFWVSRFDNETVCRITGNVLVNNRESFSKKGNIGYKYADNTNNNINGNYQPYDVYHNNNPNIRPTNMNPEHRNYKQQTQQPPTIQPSQALISRKPITHKIQNIIQQSQQAKSMKMDILGINNSYFDKDRQNYPFQCDKNYLQIITQVQNNGHVPLQSAFQSENIGNKRGQRYFNHENNSKFYDPYTKSSGVDHQFRFDDYDGTGNVKDGVANNGIQYGSRLQRKYNYQGQSRQANKQQLYGFPYI